MVDTKVVVTCGAVENRNRRRVVATLGDLRHVDRFDIDQQFSRSQWRDAVVSKFCLDDVAHEFLETEIFRAATAADEDGSPVAEDCLPTTEPHRPFPVDTLPSPISDWIRETATAIGCDPSFVALPLLVCLARAIGNSRVIRVKQNWTQPAILWGAVVGFSGSHKSPSMESAMKFLQRMQDKKFDQYEVDLADHQVALVEYEKSLATWKKSKSQDQPPWKPEPPRCEQYLTSDCTVEALTDMLAQQFDGVLFKADELTGWLDSLGQYKGGRGGDLQHWLSMWSCASITINRKAARCQRTYVPHAAVSLFGGIQPQVLQKALCGENLNNGLCARLLLAFPEEKKIRWTDAVVDKLLEAKIATLFEKLITLEPAESAEGKPIPYTLDPSREAYDLYASYYNVHREKSEGLGRDLRAAGSKMEAYTSRFALIIELCRWAAGDASRGNRIAEDSMVAAIELATWFDGEARRVYSLFSETEDDQNQRELVEWIERRKGWTTARDLQMTLRKYRKRGEAAAALDTLVKNRLARIETIPTGRKQKTVYVLQGVPSPTIFPETAESDKSVGVGTPGQLENHTNGQAK